VAQHRYRELDILRGIAIVLMVIYHLAYDLAVFGGYNLNVWSGGWWFVARASATTFLLLVGVCFAISWSRTCTMQRGTVTSWLHAYPKYLHRGLFVFGCGMMVSLATWFIAPDAFVKFGILHLIGVSILLLPLFHKLKNINVVLGLVLLWLPTRLPAYLPISLRAYLGPLGPLGPFGPFGTLFAILGLPPPGFASLDYFPLLPWFGVVLLGLAIGQTLYVHHTDWRSQLETKNYQLKTLQWLGKRSLAVYLLHQPILIAILLLIGAVTIN
jgi:uncharacterized membrane protein